AADLKVGIVDPEAVLAQSDAGQAAQAKLKAEGEQHQKDAQQKQDSLKKEQDALQKNASVETQTAQQQAQQKFQADVAAYQKWAQDTQQDFSQEQQKVLQPLQATLYDVIQSYGKDNGYDLILDKSAAIYAAGGMDVTSAILKAFNAAEAHSSSSSH
ncbi:MAG TPA: OmpH family outer membrane protein, partial [Gammaproteobacteria bacterium]|nr:OmpH family outer membrane protein [Gammaproteobacteria bacterium]